MKEKIQYNNMLFKSVFIGVMTAALVLICYSAAGIFFRGDKSASEISSGWDVYINDAVYENVKLDKFRFDAVDKYDKVVLMAQIPENTQKYALMRLMTRNAAVNIYLDGVNIYSYGSNRLNADKLLGSGSHMVELGADTSGKMIEIELTAGENNAFSTVEPPVITSVNEGYTELINDNKLSMLIGAFLLIFGVMMFILTAPAVFINRELVRFCCLGLFSLFAGIWILCRCSAAQMFLSSIWVNTYIGYTALFLMPAPLIIYLYDSQTEKPEIMKAVWLVNIIWCAGALFLHIINKVHFTQMMFVYRIILAVDAAYIIWTAVRGIRERGALLREGMKLVGTVIFAVCAIADCAATYSGMHAALVFAPVGVLVFIFSLITGHCSDIIVKLYDKVEQDFDEKVEYSDRLTGVKNLSGCEREFEKLDNNDEFYVVLSFDLNNLKVVNDAMGHSAGDKLIKSFTELLSKHFAQYGIIGRMDGDEFIVIIRDKEREWVHNKVEKMKAEVAEINKGEDMRLNVSYGYAFCDEVMSRSVRQVLKLADERMYIMKGLMK